MILSTIHMESELWAGRPDDFNDHQIRSWQGVDSEAQEELEEQEELGGGRQAEKAPIQWV